MADSDDYQMVCEELVRLLFPNKNCTAENAWEALRLVRKTLEQLRIPAVGLAFLAAVVAVAQEEGAELNDG